MAKRGRKAKTEWRACSLCGTLEGRIPPRGRTPGRNKLDKFGFIGQVGCLTCYDRLAKREERCVAKPAKASTPSSAVSASEASPLAAKAPDAY